MVLNFISLGAHGVLSVEMTLAPDLFKTLVSQSGILHSRQ